ncbi:MAG TPA: DNA polymerase I [Candidatus Scybalomonas excrementigallinarum]|nr:DNA polymerase I [Candidatus Scybalomonas excrementigallinarum]
MKKKLLLVDGHSILNRAFYGLPDLTNSEGLHTNAVLGFLNILFRFLEEEKATHLLVAFDRKEPTFRHEMFGEYKGTRKGMPQELLEQVPLMKEVLKAMEVPIVEQAGYEADDILGTISREAVKEGFHVSILSGDRDLLQLATDEILIRIPKTKAGGTTVEDYYAKDVLEKYQVTPEEFIDVKGLMGDPSDNIPGVPGIGEKTATKIIVAYHSIENAYAHLEEIKPKKAKENLEAFYDQALLSKKLATIKLDCQLEYRLEDAILQNLYTKEAYQYFQRLEFKSLLKRFGEEEKEEFQVQLSVVQELQEAELVFKKAKEQKKIGFSIFHKGEAFGVALAFSREEVYYIEAVGFLTKDYILEELKSICEGEGICATMDLKSALFDLKITEETSGIMDIGIGAYLLNPLKDTYHYEDIARDYLGISLPSKEELLGKEEVLDAFEHGEEKAKQVIAYSAYVPLEAVEVIKEKLNETEMLELYEKIEMPTIFALYDMQERGIAVNKEALKEYGDSLVGKITQLEQSIYEHAGQVFNINSPKQLGGVLFEDMKLPGAKKTKTGYSTSVDVLEKIKMEHPIIDEILEYRHLAKLKSTYADGLANFIQEDGRIHGIFNQTVTATGRISSTEPNLQNIPIRMPLGRAIRKVFIPKEGFVFVDADYSQIELRVLAHISGDETLIHAYKNHQDIHATTASEVFHVPLEEVTADQRREAKAVNFGIVYGLSAFGLSQDLNITRKQATEYIDRYFKTYPQVKEFLDNIVEEAKEKGLVRTIFHRIRPIPELSSSNFMQRNFGERVAMNSPIQGTAADIMKIATIRVNMRMKREKLKSRLILQIHDELLIEASMDEVEQVKKILEEEMMGAAELKVPLEIGISEGNNWFEAK